MLGAGFLAVCVGVSLGDYKAPEYTTEQMLEEGSDAAEQKDTAQQEKEPVKETKKKDAGKDKVKDKTKDKKKVIAASTGSFSVPDGTYEGSAEGYGGTITVAVTVKDHKIVNIEILEASGEDAAFFGRAKGVIDSILKSQSTDVDLVSGATYSSRGIVNAVKNALTGQSDGTQTLGNTGVSGGGSSAGQTSAPIISTVTEAAAYRDGVYYGTGNGFGGPVQVQVTITDGQIVGIDVIEHSDGDEYMQSAAGLLNNIIASQSTNVDTVSGATYSSAGLIEAVRNALSQAAVSGVDASGDLFQNGNQENNGQTNGNQNNGSQNNNSQNGQNTAPSGNFPYKDGIYYGTARGFYGDIRTAVVIQDKEIKAILAMEYMDDESFFQRATTVAKEIVRTQSTDVDLVSGATYSSRGIRDSVLAALEEAKRVTEGIEPTPTPTPEPTPTEPPTPTVTPEPEDPDAKDPVYEDGEYRVTVVCNPDDSAQFDAYNLSMTVTIEDQKITGITDISGDGDAINDMFIKNAVYGNGKTAGVVEQILEYGLSEDINLVSGATCSSQAIVDACVEVLNEALIKEEE